MKNTLRKYFSSTTKQWIDHPSILEQKITKLAQLIKVAKYPIFFTGAGISTSIGIPDYRSQEGTLVKTGPGIWNRKQETRPSPKIENLVDKAIPSITHMSIKTLLRNNTFKYLVSQNTDGLHLRSGVNYSQIAELHGNRNLQSCPACHSQYLRDFRTIKPNKKTEEEKRDHRTGRKCENCSAELFDSIVYFGEKLPKNSLIRAYQEATKSDLCVCIGSSLTVRPSVNVPILAKQSKANLCIINIQQTALDEYAMKINGFCDDVMSKLMRKLEMNIDKFVIKHYFQLSMDGKVLEIKGKDENNKNFMFIKDVQIGGGLFTSDESFLEVPLEDQKEIYIKLYGDKPLIELDLSRFYKIFHGESVKIQVSICEGDQQWMVQQI